MWFLLLFFIIQTGAVHDIPKFKRGPVEIFDETAISNPNSFDYDFSDNAAKAVDYEDLYDQFIQQLPKFHLFKLGEDRGVTQLPLVTRAGSTWFTKAKDDLQRTTPYPFSNVQSPKGSRNQGSAEESREVQTTTTEAPRTTSTELTTTSEAPKPRQPPPAFVNSVQKKPNRPIWRHGEIIFPETTTQKPVTPRRFELSTTKSVPVTTTTAPITLTRPTTTTTTTTAPITSTRPTTTTTTTTTMASTTSTTRTTTSTTFTPVPTTSTTTPKQPTTRTPLVWRTTTSPVPTTTATSTVSPSTRRVWEWTRRASTSAELPRTVMGVRVTTEIPSTTARWIYFRRTSTKTTTTETPDTNKFRRPESRIPSQTITVARPKPIVISSPIRKYSGPTFNCRVLNPFTDGVASAEHDVSCKMSYPGYSEDGSCRCYYKVAGRDIHGCATGFLYACKHLTDTSVRV